MQVHTVQKGDTLWKIAKMYGVDFEELKAANPQLTNPDLIMPGMKILIPGAADERPFHVVKAGDTMWKIAWMHGISVDQLIAENPQIPDPNRITVGMKVYLPTSSLIHGDIAHHNFIMGARGIRIIDFDLASYADPDEEWILLLQRFLPFADYDLQLLIDEHPDFLRVLEEQPAGLRYPNELFREWLAFLQKPHPKKQERLLAFSAKAIENHRKLWYDG